MGTVDLRQPEEKFFLTLYEPESIVLTLPASDLLIEEDMMRLKWGIDASAFGLRKSPFDIKLRYIEHPTIPEQKIRLKRACCFAYRLNTEFDYCYECPRLNEKDRALKRANGHC